MRFKYLILIGLLISSQMFSQAKMELSANKLFNFKVVKEKSDINKLNSDRNDFVPVQFEIHRDVCGAAFLSAYKQIEINDFVLSGNETVTLELQSVKTAVNEKTEWWAVENGQFKRMKGPYIASYSGKLKGQENSEVFINYYSGKLIGYIKDDNNQIYTLSPDTKADIDNTNHYVLPRDAEGIKSNENPFICLTEDLAGTYSEHEDIYKYRLNEINAKSKVLQVPILCEGSYDYYALLGSNFDYCAAYIASVINLSSKIYLDNINVNLVVNKVVIRTDAASCPYKNAADLSDKLMVMPDVWMKRKDSSSLVVLFASLFDQPAGTIVAGISMGGRPNVGSLCSVSRGYCALGIRGQYKYPTLNYTWDINVATHEIGHNFSAPHTHSCYYEPNMIDTCVTQSQPFPVGDACIEKGNPNPVPGTIMSYCHTTNATHSVELVFHERTKPLMRKAAEASYCISEAPGIFLALLHPLGDSAYQAKKTMQIRWTSKSVQSIDIMYSLDSGATWKDMAKSIPAADSIFVWNIPDVNSNKAMVAIMVTGNTSVYDKSLTVFSISKAGIFVQNPVKNERLGQNDLYDIKWSITFEEAVKIDFSSDAGASWSTIIPNTSLGTCQWIVPQIESENCKIRVISLSDNTLIGESGLFAIGKQSAKLTSPKGGEQFCIGDFNDIKWSSDYVDYLFLEYTTNNGLNWKKVTQMPIIASIGGYSWKTPNIKAAEVKFRLSTTINKNYFYLDSSLNSISIDSCLSSVDNDENSQYLKTELSPNPVSNSAELIIYNQLLNPFSADIKLIDEKGSTIQLIEDNFIINSGKNTINIHLGNIAKGTYFIQINSENIKKTLKLIKI